MLGISKNIREKILVIMLSLVLAACGSAAAATSSAVIETSTDPPPTNTLVPTEKPTEAPTETATDVPTIAATPDPSLLQFPSVNCCKGVALEAGKYQVPSWLGIPLTVEVAEGWKVLNEKEALLFLIGKGLNVQNNPSQMIAFLNVTDKITPQELIDSVQQAPELVSSEPINVMLAGFSGMQLDSTAIPNPEFQGSAEEDIAPGTKFLPVFMKYFAPGFFWTTSSPEARVRTIVLTVNDQTLLLYLEAPPNEFETFIIEAEKILHSLKL